MLYCYIFFKLLLLENSENKTPNYFPKQTGKPTVYSPNIDMFLL